MYKSVGVKQTEVIRSELRNMIGVSGSTQTRRIQSELRNVIGVKFKMDFIYISLFNFFSESFIRRINLSLYRYINFLFVLFVYTSQFFDKHVSTLLLYLFFLYLFFES